MTYAKRVASSLALFITISGGAAFAVTQLDANSVKSKHIVDGKVKEVDVDPKVLRAARRIGTMPPSSSLSDLLPLEQLRKRVR